MNKNGERGARFPKGSLVVVVGFGRSGKAALALLLREGCRVRLLEKNPDAIRPEEYGILVARGVEVIRGEHAPSHFVGARAIVLSPGIPVRSILPFVPLSARKQGCEIIAEMELAWRYLAGEPILAITGTSGKTTTVSLAAAMLTAQGLRVFLGGNIGTPLSEYVLDSREADVLVVEISSFQLQCCATFAPRVAVLMNISPNHLDYHADMQEYCDAKFRLFRWQDERDLAVLGPGLAPLAAKYGLRARTIVCEQPVPARFPDLTLLGAHNRLNAEIAWQAVRFFGVSERNAAKACAAFAPLPHRLERVRERAQVLYVNDSKCTTIAALQVALEAFDRPIRLLCGGKFKGGDLTKLLPTLQRHVVEVALYGGSRDIFTQAWEGKIPLSWHETLAEALGFLAEHAQPNDVVLLSPATSSFDQYANYVERGKDFRALVSRL